MIIYPAIYIKEGKCIGLSGGDYDNIIIYSENPVEIALKWEGKGAKYLHVIDLDGAAAGTTQNIEVIKQIISSVKIPVQVGGGIRSIESAQDLLDSGAARIIMGTVALDNPELFKQAIEIFGDKLVAGIDMKGKRVVLEGTEEVSEHPAVEFAQKLEEMGVETIVYTDITRVGTLQGSDIVGITDVLSKVFVRVIAAGGVNDITDLKRLKRLGVSGVVIGKALYTGDIDLAEALEVQ